MSSDTDQASVPALIAESFNEGDPVRDKFTAFKRDLDEKEAATHSQFK